MQIQAARIRRKGPNLIPMIDVMVLLLVFFMLASRFGGEQAIPLQVAGSATGYSGPPRLVQVTSANVALNGVVVAEAGLANELSRLMSGPGDMIVLRAAEGVDVQRIVSVMQVLQDAGLQHIVLVE